ncbi:MAG: ribosomal RNA small subunit methyltransferase A [Gaiellales bacterium]
MAAPSRGSRARHADGQHFLRPRLAAEVVAAACITGEELVVDLGAGNGRLTEHLRGRAGHVLAVELDPVLADGLRRRFAGDQRVTVCEADLLRVALPGRPYRVVANLPFGVTTAALRRLFDDPRSPLTAADLIVQDGLARKRAALRPCTMLSLSWLPWWTLAVERRLPAHGFEPPAVDAAVLAVRRRRPALLDPNRAGTYRSLLRRAFRHGDRPVRYSLPVSSAHWRRFARARGLPADARPPQLDVWDWVALIQTPSRFCDGV